MYRNRTREKKREPAQRSRSRPASGAESFFIKASTPKTKAGHPNGALEVTTNLRLTGVRVRNEASIGVEVILVAKVSEDSWRARIDPSDRVDAGDRLRFGDTSENPACFLAFLDADVVERNGETALLSFHFTGGALDDALVRLSQPSP